MQKYRHQPTNPMKGNFVYSRDKPNRATTRGDGTKSQQNSMQRSNARLANNGKEARSGSTTDASRGKEGKISRGYAGGSRYAQLGDNGMRIRLKWKELRGDSTKMVERIRKLIMSHDQRGTLLRGRNHMLTRISVMKR